MQKIVFDFGGVLVGLQREAVIASFDHLGFDIRPYLGTFRQAGVFEALENGDISVPQFCDEIRQFAQNATLSDQQIITAWENYLTGIPSERLDLLLRIRQHYPVYVLSNTNPIHWEQGLRDFFTWRGHGVCDFFDGVFLSYELHMQKPDPRIFDRVAAEIGGSTEELLFLDDAERNCEVARQQGWQARIAPADGTWMNYFDDNGRLKS